MDSNNSNDDLYAVLGLNKECSTTELRSAYKKLALRDMGFLHKLWDETLAGPAPENGLGKLRNHISGKNVPGNGQRKLIVDPGRVPDSPDASSNPGTPLTPGTPSETHATSLNAYDWIVLNALDR